LLIDDLTEAAKEAIENAAAEAARAAFLESIEREAAAYREGQQWRLEAEAHLQALKHTKKAGVKNIILAVVIGVLGGLIVGITISN